MARRRGAAVGRRTFADHVSPEPADGGRGNRLAGVRLGAPGSRSRGHATYVLTASCTRSWASRRRPPSGTRPVQRGVRAETNSAKTWGSRRVKRGSLPQVGTGHLPRVWMASSCRRVETLAWFVGARGGGGGEGGRGGGEEGGRGGGGEKEGGERGGGGRGGGERGGEGGLRQDRSASTSSSRPYP